jgi:hypothetical protein
LIWDGFSAAETRNSQPILLNLDDFATTAQLHRLFERNFFVDNSAMVSSFMRTFKGRKAVSKAWAPGSSTRQRQSLKLIV